MKQILFFLLLVLLTGLPNSIDCGGDNAESKSDGGSIFDGSNNSDADSYGDAYRTV
ncbi:MAG: hypothetical protein GY847_05925 [Proteobacteria bacterium]|nr:hypothetical protein [Pseudomonadota bacterium]